MRPIEPKGIVGWPTGLAVPHLNECYRLSANGRALWLTDCYSAFADRHRLTSVRLQRGRKPPFSLSLP